MFELSFTNKYVIILLYLLILGVIMKIGKFAEMHDITQDTVRHYLDLGLLVTEKIGGYYKFSDSDNLDIRRIIELKNLGFSLSDVQDILAMQRISGENTNSFRRLFLSYLEGKKKEVDSIILNYININKELKRKINEIKYYDKEDIQKLGFSLSSLHLLECPQCHKELTLSAGTIEQNNVIEANIHCDCGFRAEIKDGIYLDKRCVRTKLLNGEIMPSKEEYLASTTHNYSNFLYKGMTSLVEYINNYGEKPNYIVELDNCVGFILMQYIKYLPPESTYILIDYDYERLVNLKKDLESYYKHKNFLFLCCDYQVLPLKTASVDMVIDYQMTNSYEKTTGRKLYDTILPILKEKGSICGLYSYYQEPNKGMEVGEEKLYNGEEMIKLLKEYNLRLIDSTIIGPLTEGISYNKDIEGQELFQGIYICEKPWVDTRFLTF